MINEFLESQLKDAKVGNAAGWALHFHAMDDKGNVVTDPVLKVTNRDYYASIDVTLPEELQGGSYSFTIEGLIDADFGKLDKARVLKLFLYWEDTRGFGGYFKSFAGLPGVPSAGDIAKSALVAQLYVGKISRRAGTRHYDTVLEAREFAFWRLNAMKVKTTFSADNFYEALKKIGAETAVSITPIPARGPMTAPRPGEAAGVEKVTFNQGLKFADAVRSIANSLEQSENLYGRKMILIRDGSVLVGKRDIPTGEEKVAELTLGTGLLHIESDATQDADPFESLTTARKGKKTYLMTLKGRPDLKPGSVVRCKPEEVAEGNTLLSLGAAAATSLVKSFAGPMLPDLGGGSGDGKLLYVTSVRHTLGRTAGFVTVAKGVEIDGTGDKAWDKRDEGPSAPSQQPSGAKADPAAAVATEVKRIANASRDAHMQLEVGEVRAANTRAGGSVEPPSQTITAWQGLNARDGRPNAARRLPVRRKEPTALEGMAYLSPFAWGKCGLVLPRYPGMRIAMSYRHGQQDDALDIGALWQSGRGPVSQPGDWWLSLPAALPENNRASIGDKDTPQDYTGKVSQDLIDADGNRIIEVGELTIRVGKDTLRAAGTRPPDPDPRGNIVIEHTKGSARLVIRQDGSIEIAGKSISLDAGSGDITMKAANVTVNVSGAMEVKG
jgi:hypothetical protein